MRKRKVEQALSLLPATTTNLAEVAYACGFADQSYFIRAFKHYAGVLPSRYRQLVR